MHVTEILKNKGTAVFTTAPGESLDATARLLSRKRIGAVLVLDGDEVVGIVSERDIVGALAEHGAAALEMKIETIMTREVVSCAPEDSINDLMALMTNRRIRHLPVLSGGKLKGVVSIGDVVKFRLDEAQTEVDALRDYVRGAVG